MESFPQIRLTGISGVLVRFADRLSEPANRAALAYQAAAKAAAWPGVSEVSGGLASVLLRVDPLTADPREVAERAGALAASRDWAQAPLPPERGLWRLPCDWRGDAAPDLAAAADAAGVGADAALAEISSARLRVLTIGFAPGVPYLGELPERWNLPRRQALQQVPAGAVLLALRQLVIFTAPGPTGWWHIGQTAFRPFQPDAADPAPLRPGDEVQLSLPADAPEPAREAIA